MTCLFLKLRLDHITLLLKLGFSLPSNISQHPKAYNNLLFTLTLSHFPSQSLLSSRHSKTFSAYMNLHVLSPLTEALCFQFLVELTHSHPLTLSLIFSFFVKLPCQTKGNRISLNFPQHFYLSEQLAF